MEIKEKLFNSDIYKWYRNDSEFGERLKWYWHLCIVIEDTNRNMFGGCCCKQVGISKYYFDSNNFVFSMKRNNKYTMKKYALKNGCYDFYLYIDSNDTLFGFGAEDVDNQNNFRNICIVKKDSTHNNFCE